MKKNASFVNLDSSLVKWIYEKLRFEKPASAYAEELAEGLADLANNEVSTLILGLEGENDAAIVSRSQDDGIYCKALEIYPKSRKVLRDGGEISLTPKEFDILYFLARNKGDVFTKEQIYQAVWEEDYLLADSNIMAFIRKLRKKIEPNPDAPEYIITIWGFGYKFNDKI